MSADVEPSAEKSAPVSAPAPASASEIAGRLWMLRAALIALFVVLVGALAYLQLGRSQEFSARERRQNLRRVLTPAPRGVIYDREHRVLAGNKLTTVAVIQLGALRGEFAAEERGRVSPQARLAVVQRHLDRANAAIGRCGVVDSARLERHVARERMTPFVLVDDLSAEESAKLSATLGAADVIQLQRTHRRWYPHGGAAAHVLGRVRRELIRTPVGDDFPILNYHDAVGDFGIEKQHDARLRGRPGEATVRIDAQGFPVGSPLAQHDAAPGEDVTLSLDLDLQLAAERAMAATPGTPRGAAVAISVTTGEILAMASKPDFDLNAVSLALAADTKQRIEADGAWLNRATQGLYPPGSSFKVFTMLAGLREGTLRADTVYRCDGFLVVGDRRFPCHNAAGHGERTLRTALAHSCNIFACQTGLAAGVDALAVEARRFHFDEPTGIDLPGEATRLWVPDPAWKQAEARGVWTAGDTVNLAIGQGFLRVSPLQAACAMASLARRETLTVPTLLHQPGRRASGERPAEPLALAETDYAELVKSLQAVVDLGIGRDAQVPGIKIAGKTGTAQIMRPEGMMNVAWFIAFAPAERPEIAVAVAMEGDRPGVEFAGGEHAAPIVRELMGAYFDKRARR